MTNPSIKINDLPHREAESIGDTLKHIESLVILCSESIHLHAVPEMQNAGDVLQSLLEPLHEAKKKAKSLENILYADFTENGAHGGSLVYELEVGQ